MESPLGSARVTSPEAEIGHRVEDLWNDVQIESLLSPSEKLNSCFESVLVSSFPTVPSQVIEIPSDASLAAAVEILSKQKILSAPVRNVSSSEDASWIDRYMGIVEFAGIAVWLLHQSEVAAQEIIASSPRSGLIKGKLTGTFDSLTLETPTSSEDNTTLDSVPEVAASMGGSFFENLASSEIYKSTKVEDIAGSFRWAPFLALQSCDTFLTMLLLLSKYRVKSLPVVDLGEGKIENIITQSSVVHMLAECVGLHWFENWGTKTLFELGLPMTKSSNLIKVGENEPVLTAFQLMKKKGIGGLPVVDDSGLKPVGNISIRDVQYLLTAPEIYKDYRTITVKNFLTAVRKHLEELHETSAMLLGVITCTEEETIKDVILQLDAHKIHRIYTVDKLGHLAGVITLRDIISKLVHEPRHYFGDFFDGVVPMPQHCRV